MQGLSGRELTKLGAQWRPDMTLGSSLSRRKITAFSVPLEGDNHFDPGRAGCADVSQYRASRAVDFQRTVKERLATRF